MGAGNPKKIEEIVARLEAYAAAAFAKESTGGMTVGLVAGKSVAWAKSYGFGDVLAKKLAWPGTVYRIGSVTKRFTGLMLLQLVERGRVKLSDPVAKYFPEVEDIPGLFPQAPPITLLQLANHTSGLTREPARAAHFRTGPVSEWETALMAALPQMKYAAEPGARFAYSNSGYAILGAALGRAAGMAYVDYVREQIVKPLGMSSTAFELDGQMRSDLARGYMIADGIADPEISERQHAGRGYAVPNGGLYSTLEDLGKFLAFDMGLGPEEILSPELLANSRQQFAPFPTNPRSGYGVGLMALRLPGNFIYGHGGKVSGYEAEVWFEPQEQLGVIVLRNVSEGLFRPVKLAVAALASRKPRG